jgi:DNA-binding response OmpR family regulator
MAIQKNILIIDDEAGLRHSLALVLRTDGYCMTEAGTGKEAIQLLKSGGYDLIFLDLKLPDASGITLLPQIRKMYPETPVIILTGHATLDTAMEAVRHGARDYMLKPADPELILSRTRTILAELELPQKRREITSQIQSLFQELQQYEGGATPEDEEDQANPASIDPARYVRHGSIVLDLHTRHAMLDNKIIQLPTSPFDYLVTLVRHAPDVVTYQSLVRESQGYALSRAEACEICRWQVHELRKVIEENPHKPARIITIRDVGYRLVD